MAKMGVAYVYFKGYRVLKPFGQWSYGDEFFSNDAASMYQMLRRGVIERLPEKDVDLPLEVKVEEVKPKRKKADDAASV